jgi:lipopolysaccharide transport system permease protein
MNQANPACRAIPTTVIEPARGWLSLRLHEIWQYRELLYFLMWRDVKVRYKQTAIGFLWAILQPAVKMLVLSLVFGGLAKMDSEGFPYPVFVFAGLLPWEFFADAVSRSGESIVGSANLIRKVYFSRAIIPVASVGACLVDFVASFSILAILMAVYGTAPTPNLLMAVPLAALVVTAALGVGVLLSALNVAYRDFRYVVPFLIQVWMFLTPVIYPVRIIPEAWRWAVYMNPMAGIVEGYRSAILGTPFRWTELEISVLVSGVLLTCGLVYFRKMERWFADVV